MRRRGRGGAAGPAGHARPPRYGHVAGGRLRRPRVVRRLRPVVRQRAGRVHRAVQRRLERRDGGHHAAGWRAVAAVERQQVGRVRSLPVRTAAEAAVPVPVDAGQLVARFTVKLFFRVAYDRKQKTPR